MTTPAPYPSYVKSGTVLGKQLVIGVDTAGDSDTDPDATYPLGSTLTFTPSVDTLMFGAEHATVYPQIVPAQLNATGDPVTPDGGVLKLVANVGQLENDQSWYWTVTPKINGRQLLPFRMDITADTNNYLTDWQPIPAATPASAVARGPVGPAGPTGPAPDLSGYATTAQVGTLARLDTVPQAYQDYVAAHPGPIGPQGPSGASGPNPVDASSPSSMAVGTVSRDSNGTPIAAAVVWADGTAGQYVADVVSSAFPGVVDAYHITYGSPAASVYVQSTVTRDPTSGKVTSRPPIFVQAPGVTTAVLSATSTTTTPPAAGDPVLLSVRVYPSLPGSVQFKDGASVLGTASTSGGVASITTTALAGGSRSLSAVFTPTDTVNYSGSTGTLTFAVAVPYDFTAEGAIVALFDGDDLGADMMTVSSWTPRAGSEAAKPATQATGSKQPVVKANAVNGHKSAVFSSSASQLLSTAAYAAIHADPVTVILVHKVTNVTGHDSTIISGIASASGALTVKRNSGTGTVVMSASGTSDSISKGLTDLTVYHISVHVFNGTTSAHYVDSKTPVTAAVSAAANAGVGSIRFGANSGGTSYLDGEVTLAAVIGRVLTTQEVKDTMDKLSAKYALTVTA